MKTTFIYSDTFAIDFCCYDGNIYQWGWPVNTLKDALMIAESAFNNEMVIDSDDIDVIRISSMTTGEIVALCTHDDEDENFDCSSDWDEMGFDPYEGCYTDDC